MTNKKVITESELNELLANEDTADATLGEFFEPDLFSARLVPRMHVEIIPDERFIDKGIKENLTGAAVNLANSVCAKMRRKRYKKVIKEQPHLPRVVAEGDSWFLHPQVKDVIDQIFSKENPRLAILSLAAAGDNLAYMWRHNQYLKAVEKENPSFVFLSGGGNDILGAEFPGYLNDYTAGSPGQNVQRFLNANFARKLRHLNEVYNSIICDLRDIRPDLKVFVHGYDYVQPGVEKPDREKHQHAGKWLGKHMTNNGIEDPADRSSLVHYMIDKFNDQVLKTLADDNDNLHYVDVRGCVGSHEWFDEIHPNENGFNSVAVRIYNAVANIT